MALAQSSLRRVLRTTQHSTAKLRAQLLALLVVIQLSGCSPPESTSVPAPRVANNASPVAQSAPSARCSGAAMSYDRKHIRVLYARAVDASSVVDATRWSLLEPHQAQAPDGCYTRLEIHCCAMLTSGDMDAIAALQNVVELELNDVGCTEEQFAALVALPTLQRIKTHCVDAAGTALAGMAGNLNLQSVSCRSCGKLGDSFGRWVGQCRNLRWVHMDRCCVTDAMVRELTSGLRLTALSLGVGRVTDASIPLIAALETLEYLCLDDNPITGSGFSALAGHTSLQDLSLRRCRLLDMESLSALSQVPRLRGLSLEEVALSDSVLEHVAAIPSLEELALESCSIAPSGAAILARSQALRKLTIAMSPSVTDAVLTELVRLNGLEKLTLFIVDGISADGVAAFKAARPDVVVDYEK